MKVAFSSTGDGCKENFDIRFGRAQGFFVLDTDNNNTTYISNESNEAEHGAGTNAAKTMVDANVDIIITGQIGPRAKEALNASGVKIYSGMGYGTLEEAYDRYQNGLLELQN